TQGRAVSNPCPRIDMGASGGSVPPSAQPSLICGVSDDVIQVSITSGSGVRPADPQDGQDDTGGASASGSTGRSSSRASTGAAQAPQDHTGDGTPQRPRRAVLPAPPSPSTQT